MFVVDASVLAVGIGNKSRALKKLPVRLFVTDSGVQAARCLRDRKLNMVISQWELNDMPGGLLLQKIMATKSALPTIAFIKSGDHKQEAIARSLGVSVVLNEDIDDEHFREMVSHLLGAYRAQMG